MTRLKIRAKGEVSQPPSRRSTKYLLDGRIRLLRISRQQENMFGESVSRTAERYYLL